MKIIIDNVDTRMKPKRIKELENKGFTIKQIEKSQSGVYKYIHTSLEPKVFEINTLNELKELLIKLDESYYIKYIADEYDFAITIYDDYIE